MYEVTPSAFANVSDAGSSPAGPEGTDLDGGTQPAETGLWLRTAGNRILRPDGGVWFGRGANLHDTRACNACTYQAPNVAEVKRRGAELIRWGADFIRLDLESYAASEGRVHWRGVLDDPAYLSDVKEIVRFLVGHPDVYVLLSLWVDPSIDDRGWPTEATQRVWRRLASEFLDEPKVMFGLVNEPESNYDGAWNADVWRAMNTTVAAIRAIEDEAKKPYHLIAVQGHGGWARHLDYYVERPIQAGRGQNIVYEVHFYDSAGELDRLITNPAKTLPVIIGEFGPTSNGDMTLSDCTSLLRRATELKVPYLAWTFHQRCPPNLLRDPGGGGCGAGMDFNPTDFGAMVKSWWSP